MKTALLHYWLTNMRGGEKVLSVLGEMFPDADVFTHAYLPSRVSCLKSHRVRETLIASLPFGRRRPQVYLPLMPMATRALGLDGYELIISSESGPIKGIRKPKGARHLCYCHTPMRYLWDLHDDYYRDAGLGGKLAMKLFTPYLRREDLKSAESVDQFIANSRFVAGRIKRLYGCDSVVVHPPVDVDFFSSAIEQPSDRTVEQSPYYLFVGANVKYKRLDLAEAACKRMGRRLVVARAVSDEELRSLYAGAKALIFPGLEDFGIVPVEAQAAGTPVIAFGQGGALETIIQDETGVFFEKQTVESLCEAIETFESKKICRRKCTENAKRFSIQLFKAGIVDVLKKVC